MGKKKKIQIGVIKTDPRDLTKDRGHSYGKGRTVDVQKDTRTKRKNTRRAKLREALKGW